jgi:hypothetical protein
MTDPRIELVGRSYDLIAHRFADRRDSIEDDSRREWAGLAETLRARPVRPAGRDARSRGAASRATTARHGQVRGTVPRTWLERAGARTWPERAGA